MVKVQHLFALESPDQCHKFWNSLIFGCFTSLQVHKFLRRLQELEIHKLITHVMQQFPRWVYLRSSAQLQSKSLTQHKSATSELPTWLKLNEASVTKVSKWVIPAGMCKFSVYSHLPLRGTCSGPALTVCLRRVSALEGDEVNDWSTAGTNSMCLL